MDNLDMLYVILGAILWLAFWTTLITKAGYEGPRRFLMVVGMCIPMVNLVVAIYFLNSAWPVLLELYTLKISSGDVSKENPETILKMGRHLETKGEVNAALDAYHKVVELFPGSVAAQDAMASIKMLQKIIG